VRASAGSLGCSRQSAQRGGAGDSAEPLSPLPESQSPP
jgi:hypothetical protein